MVEEPADRGRGGGEGVRTRDHLANTRTLLAFVRTGLILIGLGFVIDKLEILQHRHGVSFGLPIAVAGWLVTGSALLRFLVQRRAIEGSALRTHVTWDFALIVVVAVSGALVLFWLGGN